MKKRIAVALFVLMLAAAPLAGCRVGETGSDDPEVLDIFVEKAGVDVLWTHAVAELFKNEPRIKEKHGEVRVNIVYNDVYEYAKTQILSGTTIDLAFTSNICHLYNELYQRKPVLEDLTPLYNTTIPGESVTLGGKMLEGYQRSMMHVTPRGQEIYYAIPWSTTLNTIYYNADKLKTLGIDVPLTTQQFEEACAEVKARDTFPAGQKPYAIMGVTGRGCYWEYMYPVWWAQYEGYDAFDKFLDGKYKNDSDEWVLGVDGKDVLSQTGRLRALQALERILSGDYGDNLIDMAPALDFKPAQTNFLVGYGAFYGVGNWFESEMRAERQQRLDAGQALPDIRAMMVPVISSIIEKTPTIPNDAALREIVKEIDSGKASSGQAGVSQADYDYVREARRLTSTLGTRSMSVIPAYSPAKELAKDFLLFMATDRAIKAYIENTCGMPPPYKYDVKTKAPELYDSFGGTAEMVFDYYFNPDAKFAAKALPEEYSRPICLYGGFGILPGAHRRFEAAFTGSPPRSAQDMYDAGIAAYDQNKWEAVLRDGLI